MQGLREIFFLSSWNGRKSTRGRREKESWGWETSLSPLIAYLYKHAWKCHFEQISHQCLYMHLSTYAVVSQYINFSLVQFSHSVVSDSLRPHESQHARPPCPLLNDETVIWVLWFDFAIKSNHVWWVSDCILDNSILICTFSSLQFFF